MCIGSFDLAADALEQCMSEPAVNALVAAAAALFGFALATARDLLRERRDRHRRQQAAMRNFCREMAGNQKICGSNLMLLKTEKGPIEEGKSKGLVTPLERLENGAWPLARLDLPSALLADADLLGRLEVLLAITNRVNSALDMRERFHIQHLTSDVALLLDGLARYANILIYPQEDLIFRIEEAQRELAALLNPPTWLDDLRPQINWPPG
jgi:hypothetical protein